MKQILSELIKDKKILILGYGREGRSSFSMIKEIGGFKELSVSDFKDQGRIEGADKVFSGSDYLQVIDDYDVVLKSPGIVLPKPASSYKADITAQMNVFVKKYRDRIIAVTGTKGKSTTSSMIAHVLKECNKDVLFGGNIGIPVFDLYENIGKETVIVLEMSCHQLEYIDVSPSTAVLLNIYEDHLDHYGTREKYAEAKRNIYKFQKSGDLLFTTKEAVKGYENFEGSVTYVDISDAPFSDFSEIKGSMIKGKHNVLNATFVYDVVKNYGIDKENFCKALESFKGLRHRLEFIGNKDGVDYYDDSISTTVMSSINAVESVNNAKILLLGGMERDLEYEELIDYVSTSKLDSVIFMYASGKRMYDMFLKKRNVNSPLAYYEEDLYKAVCRVKKVAKEGSAVLLSPASASYDHFKNFEERGDIFKSLIF